MNKENDKWKEKYHQYVKSAEWFELKLDLLQKRGCKCEKCGKKKEPTSLQIHHLTYKRIYNERSEDLIILCRRCHMKEHGLIKKPKPKANKKQQMNQVIYKYKAGKFKNFQALVKAIKKAS